MTEQIVGTSVDDLLREQREEIDRLGLLVEAAGRLLATLDLDEVLPQVLDLAQQTVTADGYSLWRRRPNGDWFLHAAAGLSTGYVVAAQAAIRDNDAHVSLDGPIVAGDIASTEWLTPAHREAHAAEGNKAFLAMPLHHHGEVIGTLVFYYRSARTFTEQELAAANAVANLAAAGIGTAAIYEQQAQFAEERRLIAEASARLYQEALQNERQVRFLAEAGTVLSASLDLDDTLAALARLAVPEVADWCIVDIVDDHEIKRIAVASGDPDQQEALDQLRIHYPPTWDSPQPAARALREGGPVIYDSFDPELLEETVIDARHFELMKTLDPTSAIAIPLVARGETLGAITFAWSRSGRTYSRRDLPLIEDLATRAAIAVDNARLFQREHAAAQQLAFLAEASTALASSLDVETTLTNVAHLVVPEFADWCAVDLLDEDGALRRLAVAHQDPEKLAWTIRSRDEFPPTADEPEGTGRVVRTGEAALYRTITPELLEATTKNDTHLKTLMELGMASAMVVPLKARGRTLGALQFVSSNPARLYNDDDLRFAEHIGRKAAAAVDNALLYRRAEQRASAARALAFVGDGVFLVDEEGVIRIWNTAAAVITGLPEPEVLNHRADDAIPGWSAIEAHVPLASGPGVPNAETVPIELHGAERWLSISGVAFPGGTVYAFRDLTEELRLDRLKSEFVSTVSHELRTPLAAIYGAALTLRRDEPALEAQRDGLLDIIAGESERLARIVNDILYASRLESGTLHVAVESCDPRQLAATVVEASRAHVPSNIAIALEVASDVPAVAADPDKVRQVLTNLVDNAVKYSPDGGDVLVDVSLRGEAVCFAVHDEGLGIPTAELPRVFEKFYRLDPELTRGVGGTGLGLYITRELVRRMNGRVDVESQEGKGSTFRVELPIAR